MSSPRDDGFYGKVRRSTPVAESQSSGFFRTGQGGRPVLPPISSAFPTSRSPAPNQYSNQYAQQRASPGRNEFNAASYGHQWSSTTPPQQHAYYEPYDPRYGATQYSSARASQSLANDPYDSHRLPPMSMSMAPLAHREDDWPTSPFTPHMPFSDEIRSPTASYPPQYASHQIPQQPSYPYPVIPSDTRNMHFPAASYNQHSTHMGPQSSAERVVVSRGKEVHPYARSTATPQSVSYGSEPVAPTEEPVIKKKRKRADAAQLKVLNETYQRTAFPSTEERQALATQLDMPPRSVQIWFQNKRQSERQSNRPLSTTATPAAHLDDPQVPVGGYGSDTSMNPTTAGPLYLSPSSRDHPHHRLRNRDDGDPRKWSHRRY